ncbi:MAG: 3-hydroxybutyrate dehydrogenase [Pseudomonadota bacterium]
MLDNKTAIITGSTSGIGYGIATALARAGCKIMLNGFIDEENLSKIKKELEIFGNQVSYSNADITNHKQIQKMIEQTERELGSVDILVNNAGIQRVHPIESFPDSDWDNVLAANLTASFHTIKHALPSMRKQKWGRIINIASAHGLVASINKAAYVAAKHGLIGLTKVIALETAKEDITCNAICPGWVLTPLVQKQINDRALLEKISIDQANHDLLAEKQPSLQFVSPNHIGEMVVFLCSDAASQIKGSALSIDGGWTAQ